MKLKHIDDSLFVIGSNSDFKGLHLYVTSIPEATYEVIKTWAELNKEKLTQLLALNNKNECKYWEEDWHDKFVNMLLTQFVNLNRADISNSLSALGY